MEIPVEPGQHPKLHSVSVQTCPSTRNVRIQVVPKRSCKGELLYSVTDLEHGPVMIFLVLEVQVHIGPTYQDTGVQCDLQFSEHTSLKADASVQCDIECPLFVSTPRIDYYSTSESESDAPRGTDTSTGTYHPLRDIQSSLS